MMHLEQTGAKNLLNSPSIMLDLSAAVQRVLANWSMVAAILRSRADTVARNLCQRLVEALAAPWDYFCPTAEGASSLAAAARLLMQLSVWPGSASLGVVLKERQWCL